MEGFEKWMLDEEQYGNWLEFLTDDQIMEASESVERLRAHIDRKDAEIFKELRTRARLHLADCDIALGMS